MNNSYESYKDACSMSFSMLVSTIANNQEKHFLGKIFKKVLKELICYKMSYEKIISNFVI